MQRDTIPDDCVYLYINVCTQCVSFYKLLLLIATISEWYVVYNVLWFHSNSASSTMTNVFAMCVASCFVLRVSHCCCCCRRRRCFAHSHIHTLLLCVSFCTQHPLLCIHVHTLITVFFIAVRLLVYGTKKCKHAHTHTTCHIVAKHIFYCVAFYTVNMNMNIKQYLYTFV